MSKIQKPVEKSPNVSSPLPPKSENVEPNLKGMDTASRYQYCHKLLFDKLPPIVQKRVTEAKSSEYAGRDFQVEQFVRATILLADSYEETGKAP